LASSKESREAEPMQFIALTGTPGTGKSAVASKLRSSEITLIELGPWALEHGTAKEAGGEIIIDMEATQKELGSVPTPGPVVIDSHLSHLLDLVDLVVVLRCHPGELEKRLSGRGYSKEKLHENLEAEAVDVVLQEALELHQDVFEIDTTEKSVEKVASSFMDIIEGRTGEYMPGKQDWSEVIMEWY